MYRNTRFGELLKGISRGMFDRLVKQRDSDKYSKGFRSWDQMVAMIYAQLSQCRSLREVETGFNNQAMHHYHLGCGTVKRSTLSDANAKKDAGLFMDVCQSLLTQANRKVRKEVKKHLCLLDSTSITLKGKGYDEWTAKNSTRNTQGIKMHMLFHPKIEVPTYLNITEANVNDITDAVTMEIEKGATYVFDKGYCDYSWWHKLDQKGSLFVTRFKRNAALKVIKEQVIPTEARHIVLEDNVVKFNNKHPRAGRVNHYKKPLRQVVIKRPEHKTSLVIATNDFNRSALEIAECYKARWGIELFFKWIKQNLKLKTYLGRSENAVRIQIITAIISYLLIALYRQAQVLGKSMKEMFILIGTSLFQRQEIDCYWMEKRRRSKQNEYISRQGVLI